MPSVEYVCSQLPCLSLGEYIVKSYFMETHKKHNNDKDAIWARLIQQARRVHTL
jgi:hypothetical protein